MRSFSNCKIAAILAHDPECFYLFKLLLSCCITWLTPLWGPIVSFLYLLGWGYDFPKNGQKGRDANKSLKRGGMPKNGGEVTNVGITANV